MPPVLPRPTTQARHLRLHDALLAAAEATIATHGLPALRARTLADQVGCSIGAIYGVFDDLDTLILAVNARTLEALDAALDQAEPTLVGLAEAYLAFAAADRPRWSALFDHRLPEGRSIPASYAALQHRAFSHVETPLGALRPDLPTPARALLARTLFAAVHGMVQLGLDEKLLTLDMPVLRAQLRTAVDALTQGLAHGKPSPPGRGSGEGKASTSQR